MGNAKSAQRRDRKRATRDIRCIVIGGDGDNKIEFTLKANVTCDAALAEAMRLAGSETAIGLTLQPPPPEEPVLLSAGDTTLLADHIRGNEATFELVDPVDEMPFMEDPFSDQSGEYDDEVPDLSPPPLQSRMVPQSCMSVPEEALPNVAGQLHARPAGQKFEPGASAKFRQGPLTDKAAESSHASLGDFTVLRVIGAGGSGRVLHVKRRGEDLALKMIRKARIDTQKRRERAVAEQKILAACHHPFIVQLRGAFQTPSHLFLLLEYCGGGELFHHTMTKGKLENDDALFYVAEVSLGLEYLHTLKVVYRDLKPENVLLDSHGHVKLTDFGLSKQGVSSSKLLTSMVGTAGYLAPEVVQSMGHGVPFDYYCLGCLIYVLLTGALPHYNGDFQTMLRDRIQGLAPKYPNWVSADAVDVITKLLEKDPEVRIHKAVDVRKHPWFKDVDWGRVYLKQWRSPPIDPSYNLRNGIANFASEFTKQPVPRELEGFQSVVNVSGQGVVNGSPQSQFPGYTPTSPQDGK